MKDETSTPFFFFTLEFRFRVSWDGRGGFFARCIAGKRKKKTVSQFWESSTRTVLYRPYRVAHLFEESALRRERTAPKIC